MPNFARRAALAIPFALVVSAMAPLGAAAPDLRARVYHAFSTVRSYKLTVLGTVRSVGVWQAPNRYQMTTEFDGKPVKTIIIGRDYWTLSDGKWQRSGTANQLDVDIAGLLRVATHDKTPFLSLPDQVRDGRRVGTFAYTFKNGTQETCNYDRATYRVTRCKADELILLYSAYNDPANRVTNPLAH